jgi:predicted dehydrogenase
MIKVAIIGTEAIAPAHIKAYQEFPERENKEGKLLN